MREQGARLSPTADAMPRTTDGRGVHCYLFNDGYTDMVGPTEAIYYRGPNQVCMPDGTATGTCRRWVGRFLVRPQNGVDDDSRADRGQEADRRASKAFAIACRMSSDRLLLRSGTTASSFRRCDLLALYPE